MTLLCLELFITAKNPFPDWSGQNLDLRSILLFLSNISLKLIKTTKSVILRILSLILCKIWTFHQILTKFRQVCSKKSRSVPKSWKLDLMGLPFVIIFLFFKVHRAFEVSDLKGRFKCILAVFQGWLKKVSRAFYKVFEGLQLFWFWFWLNAFTC